MSGHTLGEFLRQERERRGITIEQVASATKISVRLLHSIEADRYGELPAKPFVRGFVQSYARFVGLDAAEVLARYKGFIDERSADRPAKDSGHSGYAFEKKDADRGRQMLWAVMGSFVVLGAVVFFVVKPAFKHREETPADRLRAARSAQATPPAAPQASARAAGSADQESAGPMPASGPPVAKVEPRPAPKAAEDEEVPETVAQAPTGPSPATGAAEPSDVSVPSEDDKDPLRKGDDLSQVDVRQKVVFKSLADIWVRYQVDDRPAMRFMLRADRIIVLKAREQVRFQVSNPKSAMVRYRTSEFKRVEDAPNLETVRETATLIYPIELAEKIEDPFPGMAPLPHTPDPGERVESN